MSVRRTPAPSCNLISVLDIALTHATKLVAVRSLREHQHVENDSYRNDTGGMGFQPSATPTP